MKKKKNRVCAVSSLGMKRNYLHAPFHMMYTYRRFSSITDISSKFRMRLRW